MTLAAPFLHAADKVIRLKLGTLAPAGTSYHKSMQAMGEQWRKALKLGDTFLLARLDRFDRNLITREDWEAAAQRAQPRVPNNRR